MSFSLYISTLAVSDTTILIMGNETFFSSKNLHKGSPICDCQAPAVSVKLSPRKHVCAEGACFQRFLNFHVTFL